MPADKKLFLLDAFALIYRAHFAFTKNPRINSKGQNTSVPFGFTNTLLEVIQKQKPTHIGVAFDRPEPTFRSELFEDYKAHREEAPEGVQHGVPIVKDIVKGFNIPILEKSGYEADDIIGALATAAAAKGFEVYMMTPDKDFGQLVTDRIFLYKPAYTGSAVSVMGVREVCEKWNIDRISQVVDMLGLQGDAADNIPGIPGIGPKTAATLLKKYDTLENIIAHAAELKGKQKERIEQYGEQALLSKKLATITVDVPLEWSEEALAYTPPDKAVLQPIFEKLEFKTLARRMFSTPSAAERKAQPTLFTKEPPRSETAPASASGAFRHRTLQGADSLAKLAAELCAQPRFAVEIHTDADVHVDFTLTGMAFAVPGCRYYVPISTPEEARKAVQGLADAFTAERVGKVGHHLKRALLALKPYGVKVRGALFDTQLAHYLLAPEQSHALDRLAEQYLNIRLPEGDEESPLSTRAEAALLLAERLAEELEQTGQYKLMSDVEAPLITVLADMEAEGIRVDEKSLYDLSKTLQRHSRKAQQEIYHLAGMEFNIASPKQVGQALFEHLKLVEKPKKTRTGQYATGEDILSRLAAEHEIVAKMLRFREYEKLRSTYVDTLPKMIHPSDRRIRTDYRQAVAATGRLSSVNPNLQNIPIRTPQGREIRKAFIPRNEHYLLMSADYSQIELRIAAAFAQDETMMQAFRSGRDVHATTAAKIFNTAPEDITPDMRRKAKEVNFGILYGSGAFGLAQNLRISRTEAAQIIDAYFAEFSAIRRYMDQAIEQARQKGYVETLLGRRRYLHDINSRNAATRGFAERNAINAPIQGSAADIIKIAMLHIHRWLDRHALKTKILLQVHDELVFDLYKEEEERVKPKVVELMKNAVALDVPMEVAVGVGDNWLQAH